MTKVKICGITRLQDALLAQELGADAVGFVFYTESKRYIEPFCAAEIAEKINIKKVGVFVGEKPEKINEIAHIAGLDFVQMHGFEPQEDCRALNYPYIKNIRSFDDINTYKNAAIFMVDSKNTKQWGGTGELADWDFALEVARTSTLMLSGGLDEYNIQDAIKKVKPDWVDVSSSLEDDFGIKNPEKLKRFFDRIKL